MSSPDPGQTPKSPLQEIIQPFVDLVHAPRALWGINLAYVLEGMVYFGMLGYLAIYFSSFVFQGVEHADEWSHSMVMVLTAGITIAMFFLGFVADKAGVRFALIAAFILMLIGRVVWAGAPNVLGLEPIRPGVFAGDRVSLHVTQLDTRDGIKAITRATVIANNQGGGFADAFMAIDLADGDGVVPSATLESRLVRLSRATVVSGEEHTWKVQYGAKPVEAHLFAHAAPQVGLCAGAVISLDNAYVSFWEDKDEWVIRTHWAEDFASVDTSACSEEDLEKARRAKETAEDHESIQRARERKPVAVKEEVENATEASIAQLRDTEDGPVDVLLSDVYVTYVRNGGYFVQGTPDGAAIFTFVRPFWSALHVVTICGMLLVVVGYGMYQPAAYAGVRQFTTPKTAAMGFAMLYALMNLGGWLPTFAFLARDDDWLGLGISGTYWIYTGFTLVALLATFAILTRATVRKAITQAKEETEAIKAAEQKDSAKKTDEPSEAAARPVKEAGWIPVHLWVFVGIVLAAAYWRLPVDASVGLLLPFVPQPVFAWPLRIAVPATLAAIWLVLVFLPATASYIARHPLANAKFFFFIFALIPVQTLFTYNWLVLPQYISRAFDGWIGEYFEIAANANPILIFVAVPMIAAVTMRAKVYNMMIYGTFIMAAPAFLLVLGPHWWALFLYILIMTIGEAMWQPRFLQYAAEIAPEGRTGEYMGVAQLPWFLTKVLVPLLYSGQMMDKFCPAEGPKNTEAMWFIFACIAMSSTVLLILAKGWIGKDFKTKAE